MRNLLPQVYGTSDKL